ncbi:hypothetical protein [Kitasatospora brasiliensis]|uniref:hypothetical protein n=1 Tax=Kitasatospora brasiliensis TaxID=3058040 RepID=UPI00292EAC82|nr:hypothetical protein [Kitasatospora sp. K002]
MTDFQYRNEAHLEPAEFGRFAGLIEAAAQHVADLSAFALPRRIVVCAVTPDVYIARQVEHNVAVTRLALATLPAGSTASELSNSLVDRARRGASTLAAHYYPTCRATLLRRDSGTLDLTFIPEVYDQHLHPTGRQLVTLFAHQLASLAQYEAYPELLFAQVRCSMLDAPKLLPEAQRRRPVVLTPGYSQHIERLVSKALCGQAVVGALPDEPPPSDVYRDLRADLASPVSSRQVDESEAFVVALLGAGGNPLLRQVLGREDLYPTAADLADPTRWLTRHEAAVADATENGSDTAGDG